MGLFVCFVIRISAMLQVFSRFFGKSLNLCYIYRNYDFFNILFHSFNSAYFSICLTRMYAWKLLHVRYYFKILFYISIKKNRYQGIIILHKFKKNSDSEEFCREKFETFFSALYLSLFISCVCVNGIIQLRKTTPQVTFKG